MGARPTRADGFASVIFDCDSTLSAIEGIDELAGPHAAEIAALTDSAMEGTIPLEEVYGRRLAIIRPNRERVEALGRQYVEMLVEDARGTVAALRWLGKDVRVVSGGLLPPVRAVAAELGIPESAVAAVGIEFDAAGEYAGFETSSPLARSGGKPVVVRDWAPKRPSLLVGDGSTDMEARDEVDFFVAYMGVAYREKVAAGADLVLRSRSLAPILALAAGPDDRHRLHPTEWRDLLLRGEKLLEQVREAGTAR